MKIFLISTYHFHSTTIFYHLTNKNCWLLQLKHFQKPLQLCLYIQGAAAVLASKFPPPPQKWLKMTWNSFWVIFGGWKFLRWGGQYCCCTLYIIKQKIQFPWLINFIQYFEFWYFFIHFFGILYPILKDDRLLLRNKRYINFFCQTYENRSIYKNKPENPFQTMTSQ